MRSKNSKKRSAYRRGEKIIIFLKRGIIVLSIFILVLVVALGVKLSAGIFHVRNILVYGNYHLEEDNVISSLNIKKGESLLKVSFEDLEKRLERRAWIKKASLRKQFPDTLMVRIEEAAPKALLGLNGRMFLIDDSGSILEEIKGKSTPFLPVIKDINPKKKWNDLLEALKLVEALAEKHILYDKESIEVSLEPYGLAMNVDGKVVRVGYGGYSKKLDKWKELESEMTKRGIAIDYIDLRFKDVIVKPFKKTKLRRFSSKLLKRK